MLHVIWQSHLGAVQNAVCLGKACWCRKTLRQHDSIAAAGRRLKITSPFLSFALQVSKCTLCMLLELWKLAYLELERVEELTRSLSDHLSTNQNIRISVWELSRRVTIQGPTERPEANYTGAFGHWSASASRCLKAPNSDMHAQCMCLCVCASALALHSYPPMSCHRAAVLVTGV